MPLIKSHANLSSKVRGINYCMRFILYLYFEYVNNKMAMAINLIHTVPNMRSKYEGVIEQGVICYSFERIKGFESILIISAYIVLP